MPDFDDYTFDDDIFAHDAGINEISEAYAKVFDSFIDLATEGKSFAESGSTKEVCSTISKLASRVSALVQLGALDKKIVNGNGTVFNVFGKELSDINIDDDDEDTMTEGEFIQELNKIVSGCMTITFDEAVYESEKSKDNIEDDGTDHGDLDALW